MNVGIEDREKEKTATSGNAAAPGGQDRTGQVRIGISGWRYKPWRGVFYPPGLQQRRELEFASRQINSIELNGTHYSLGRPEHFRRWAGETPDDFVFAVKGSRFITHMRKLREVEAPLANFFAQGLLELGAKLGPVLWQFPPRFIYEPERLAAFFRLLPRTMAQASALAHEHTPALKGRATVEAKSKGVLRHCVKIRHGSFVTPEFVVLLRQHRIGLVVADTVDWPLLFDLTADFVYCRLHGSEQLYTSGYEAEAIERWASRVVGWSRGQEAQTSTRSANRAACTVAQSWPAGVAPAMFMFTSITM